MSERFGRLLAGAWCAGTQYRLGWARAVEVMLDMVLWIAPAHGPVDG